MRCVVVFYDGLIGWVGAGHNKRCIRDFVKEHVVQACVGQHDADIVQVRSHLVVRGCS